VNKLVSEKLLLQTV